MSAKLISDLRFCASADHPLSECSHICSRFKDEITVDPTCAGKLMMEAADALEEAEAGVSVRCYNDCCWMTYFPGGLYEPPSYDCMKELELDKLGIVPEYSEFDEADVPDCPFYLNHDKISELYESYIHLDADPFETSEELDNK